MKTTNGANTATTNEVAEQETNIVAGHFPQTEEATPVIKSLEELFAKPLTTVIGGANQLEKTAQLTQLSKDIAGIVWAKVNATLADEATTAEDKQSLLEKFAKSEKDNDLMDALIREFYDIDITPDFLGDVSEDDLTKMLRSQQSKRSRAKTKKMDMENYMSMMTGAVAENLIRNTLGMPKASGGGTSSKLTDYSDEKVAELLADPEKLKKAIRNVQSKISIAKSKAGFDAVNPGEHFAGLRHEEAFLKDLRSAGNQAAVPVEAAKALETVSAMEDQLADVDIEAMDPADAKELMKQMQQMLASK
jgi:uncharacterized protein with von Willebrand factor type A (vWA) domain